MRILYAETTAFFPSSAHFLEALSARAAAGICRYRFFDEARFLNPRRSIAERVAARVVGRPSGYQNLNRALVEEAASFAPDLILIGKGRWFAPATLNLIKQRTGALLVNWATDDPFNPADTSRDLVESIPIYDLYVCTKRAIVDDVRRAGCRNTAYIRFGYKPGLHYPELPATDAEKAKYACDVAFVGGCDSDRAPFFKLLTRELPAIRLNLFGGYWNRFPALRRYWRGFANGRDFRLAIGGAKISVNLVRRANRDDHVMRTFEIPACGGFMLTERTPDHAALFKEDREAAFFDSPEEFVAQVRRWLASPQREQIAAAARRRVISENHCYADRLEEILAAAEPLLNSRALGSELREFAG
jgi:spore maturation protein CgeB